MRHMDRLPCPDILARKQAEWQRKYEELPNDAIPVTAALDPCRDSDEEIQANITFEDEVIRAVPGSVKGLNTIQKYRLNTELLDSKRAKWLNRIAKVIINIQNNLIKEGRDRCTAEEMRKLQLFMQPDSPYSLMSTIYISKIKLLSYLCAH